MHLSYLFQWTKITAKPTKNKWIIYSILLLLLSAAIMIVSCSIKKESGSKVTLTFAHYEDRIGIKQFDELINEFKIIYPSIDIKQIVIPAGQYQGKILTSVAGGMTPDVFYSSSQALMVFANKGAIQSLTRFFKKETGLKIEGFHPSVVDALTYKDNIWGLPKGCTTFVLYYNKDLFDKAGLRYPDETWTWDDLIEAGKRFTKDVNGDGRIDQFGLIQSWGWGMWFWGTGGNITTQNGRKIIINYPEAVESIRFATDLTTKYRISPTTAELSSYSQDLSQDILFFTGRTAMYIAGRWLTSPLREKKALEWDVAPLPRGPKARKTQIAFTAWVMGSNTKHPEECWKFIKFLAGPAGARYFAKHGRDIPALMDKEALGIFLDPKEKPMHSRVFIDAFNYSQQYPAKGAWYPLVERFLWNAVDEIKINKMDAKDALDKAAPKMQEALDQFWTEFDTRR